MPQMSPMNWILLYMLFTMIFLMFNFLNYYMFMLNNNNLKFSLLKFKLMNWKW